MTLAAVLWITEFFFESLGFALSFRRRLYLLSALLAWRALADLITFAIGVKFGGDAYGVSMWAAKAIQYGLICALAVQLAAKLMRDRGRISPYVLIVGVFGAGLVVRAFVLGDTWAHKFTDAEISAGCVLCGVLLISRMTSKGHLEGVWRGVEAGLLVSVAGNVFCAMLAAYALYPIPAIAALGIWCWSAWRPTKIKIRSWAVRPMEMK